jgi:hypothetical protein
MTDTNGNGASNNGATSNGVAAGSAAAIESAAAQVLSGGELDKVLRKAVSDAYAGVAKTMAADALAAVLTDDVRAQMAATATANAKAVLNSQDEKKTQYPTVQAFVENYVCDLYRREVTDRNSEKYRRWCPQWWRHGEARARFHALWMAFEELRQGAGVEQSVFWLTHFTPHMNALLDVQGPFRYCSPAEGHRADLAALPFVPAPANYSSSEIPDQEHPSGLIVPATPARRVRARQDFP